MRPSSTVAPLLTALAVVLLCAAPGAASLVEQASGHLVAYQFDGNGHHDAPDACQEASPEWSLPWGGATDGILVPPDDLADSYLLDVPPSAVGHRLSLAVADPSNSGDLDLMAFAPGCIGTVFDPLNLPSPPPSPPPAGPGERQVAASTAQDWECDARQWTFLATQVGDAAPAAIDVAWTDGREHSVALSARHGPNAVYSSADDLGVLVKGAWINLPASWDGNFLATSGPCDAQDGGAVYGEAPTLGTGLLAFTPIHAGPHVVRVTLHDAPRMGVGPVPCAACLSPIPLEEPGEIVQPIVAPYDHWLGGVLADPTHPTAPPAALPSLVVPASCHYCVSSIETVVLKASYSLSSVVSA